MSYDLNPRLWVWRSFSLDPQSKVTPNSEYKPLRNFAIMDKLDSALNWDVFVTPGIPIVTADRPADVQETFFQAMAATLIYGIRDAVLVDAFMTTKQANDLADWVASKGKNLTTITLRTDTATTGLESAPLIDRFPNAKVVATPDTVKMMRFNASPECSIGRGRQGFRARFRPIW